MEIISMSESTLTVKGAKKLSSDGRIQFYANSRFEHPVKALTLIDLDKHNALQEQISPKRLAELFIDQGLKPDSNVFDVYIIANTDNRGQTLFEFAEEFIKVLNEKWQLSTTAYVSADMRYTKTSVYLTGNSTSEEKWKIMGISGNKRSQEELIWQGKDIYGEFLNNNQRKVISSDPEELQGLIFRL